MKTLMGQELVDTLRKSCDKATKRLWVASPFIGHWATVRRVLGRKWIDDAGFSVRLITDILNANNLNYETLKYFYDRGAIKEIKGLHAKIYIIDNDTLVTSANLTSTAFSKRYEVGVFLYDKEAIKIIDLYEEWWGKIAVNIPSNWLPKIAHKHTKTTDEEAAGRSLKTRWNLPPDPGAPGKALAQRFLDYEAFRAIYKDFANIYANIQRVMPNLPLYLEVDSFLNYLFHNAQGKPSNKYYHSKPRQLTEEQRRREIEKYALLFKKWIANGSDGVETTPWREKFYKTIKELLSKENIDKLDRERIKKVVDCLHCMNSMAIQKHKFLNPRNNDIHTIQSAWKDLLYGEGPVPVKMNRCKEKLSNFGRSSIQEILGNYNPDEYPLRNTNCNSGLRFFGYDVSPY